jgi:prepilin-type N-terminal cleavage/methylation domain-containing protein
MIMRKKTKISKGVTLVELIMTIVILSFVALATAFMIGGQLKGMLASSDLVAGGNAARLAMERLSNLPYASVANGSLVVAPFTMDWTIATVPGANGTERKDITMTTQRTGSGDNLLTLYTSFCKDVSVGA